MKVESYDLVCVYVSRENENMFDSLDVWVTHLTCYGPTYTLSKQKAKAKEKGLAGWWVCVLSTSK